MSESKLKKSASQVLDGNLKEKRRIGLARFINDLTGFIINDKTSFRIALFLLINTTFMFVEFVYGFYSNSLGLISDACHMLFDCAALVIGLYASYISKLSSPSKYAYGYGRFEVLSGFVNAVFLILIAVLIVVESIERILVAPKISTQHIMMVSLGGLVVNLVGLVFFHDAHHHAHGGCSHAHHAEHEHEYHSTGCCTDQSHRKSLLHEYEHNDHHHHCCDSTRDHHPNHHDSELHNHYSNHHCKDHVNSHDNGLHQYQLGPNPDHDQCLHHTRHQTCNSPQRLYQQIHSSHPYSQSHAINSEQKFEYNGFHDHHQQQHLIQNYVNNHAINSGHDSNYHQHHQKNENYDHNDSELSMNVKPSNLEQNPHSDPNPHKNSISDLNLNVIQSHTPFSSKECHSPNNIVVPNDNLHTMNHDGNILMDESSNKLECRSHHVPQNTSASALYQDDEVDSDDSGRKPSQIESRALISSQLSIKEALSSGNAHVDHNMHGIFLHVLADTLGSVGVVISTLLIKYKGWVLTDPICSIFISILIISSVVPLLRNSAEVILQRVPRVAENALERALTEVEKLHGVMGQQQAHFWSFTPKVLVGSIHVLVSDKVDKQMIRKQVTQLFSSIGVSHITVQVEDFELFNHSRNNFLSPSYSKLHFSGSETKSLKS